MRLGQDFLRKHVKALGYHGVWQDAMPTEAGGASGGVRLRLRSRIHRARQPPFSTQRRRQAGWALHMYTTGSRMAQ
eukprot:3470065-Pyramimonas_sp.AAC.1